MHNVNIVQYIIFHNILVGILGVTTKIGAGVPFSLTPYAGTTDANNLCDVAYQENETTYVFTLLHSVNRGLTQCNQEIQQHRRQLKAIVAQQERLQARLTRIADNTQELSCAGNSKHIRTILILYTVHVTTMLHHVEDHMSVS